MYELRGREKENEKIDRENCTPEKKNSTVLIKVLEAVIELISDIETHILFHYKYDILNVKNLKKS